jgi:hypothetical protein
MPAFWLILLVEYYGKSINRLIKYLQRRWSPFFAADEM